MNYVVISHSTSEYVRKLIMLIILGFFKFTASPTGSKVISEIWSPRVWTNNRQKHDDGSIQRKFTLTPPYTKVLIFPTDLWQQNMKHVGVTMAESNDSDAYLDFLKNLKATMRFLQKQEIIPFEKGILMLTPLNSLSEAYSEPCQTSKMELFS